MSKKQVILGTLVCLAGLLLFIVSCSGTETSTYQPNMVFVLTDDLDFASAQKMPRIRSQLIEEGTSFENAFVSFPTCCPSQATILTSLYAHT
jgi:N-acetylglucosamine-6-sulfatase